MTTTEAIIPGTHVLLLGGPYNGKVIAWPKQTLSQPNVGVSAVVRDYYAVRGLEQDRYGNHIAEWIGQDASVPE